jgi:hypothetical protein
LTRAGFSTNFKSSANKSTRPGTGRLSGAMIDLLIVIAFVVHAIGSGLRARHKAS